MSFCSTKYFLFTKIKIKSLEAVFKSISGHILHILKKIALDKEDYQACTNEEEDAIKEKLKKKY